MSIRLLRKALAHLLAGAEVGAASLFVRPASITHVAPSISSPPARSRPPAAPDGRLRERALEQLGKRRRSPPALGQLPDATSSARPARSPPPAGVKRQQGGELDGARAGAALEHAATARGSRGGGGTRDLVRDCAGEVVPEAQHVRTLPGDEFAEAAPAIEVADVLELVREHVGQPVELEAGPEHGRVAEGSDRRARGVDPSL